MHGIPLQSRQIFGVVIGVAAASCVVPPLAPQAMPPGSPGSPGSPPAAQTSSNGTCEDACGQIAGCELAPYDTCVAECASAVSEDPAGARERLDAITRTSCEELAASLGSVSSSSPEVAAAEDSDPAPGAVPSGRWVSEEWASYTNAAMVSADFYLTINVADDGGFSGSWARYICIVQSTYGVWSCGMDKLDGTASGRLDADGTGVIELENVGRSALVWSADTSGISIELPRHWQGEDALLFRSKLKR